MPFAPYTARNHCTELSVPSQFNAPSQSMHAWSSACPLLHTPSETIARSSASFLGTQCTAPVYACAGLSMFSVLHAPSQTIARRNLVGPLNSMNHLKPKHGAQHMSSELNAPSQFMQARSSACPLNHPKPKRGAQKLPSEFNAPSQFMQARSSACPLNSVAPSQFMHARSLSVLSELNAPPQTIARRSSV
jgi:hypothetical protein